jgi:hypothetical protein
MDLLAQVCRVIFPACSSGAQSEVSGSAGPTPASCLNILHGYGFSFPIFPCAGEITDKNQAAKFF